MVDQRIDRFLASPALSDSTRRAYGVDVQQFNAWLASRGLTLDDIDVRSFADYAAELGRRRPKLAPATIGRVRPAPAATTSRGSEVGGGRRGARGPGARRPSRPPKPRPGRARLFGWVT
ncbi:MAG: hypothetical protein E6G38_11025 [Actinobacteria bacterium]|nr:MAG: hypothetical protein E6G38_11025 [Actinomycetota bacterium]